MAYETSRSTPNGPLLLAGLSLLPQLLKAASASGDQAFRPMSRWSPIRAQGATGGFGSGWSQGSQALFSSSSTLPHIPSQAGILQEGDPPSSRFSSAFQLIHLWGRGKHFF